MTAPGPTPGSRLIPSDGDGVPAIFPDDFRAYDPPDEERDASKAGSDGWWRGYFWGLGSSMAIRLIMEWAGCVR